MAKPSEIRLSNLEAILFDLDDTLVQTTYFNDQSLAAVAKVLEDRHIELALSEQEVRDLILKVKIQYGTAHWKVFEELEKGLGIHDRKILTELTLAYDLAEDNNIRLFPGVTELLKFLIQKGIKTGIVTNGDSYRQWKKLILTGIQDVFDVVIISEEVGIEKPDPSIYRRALYSLEVESNDAMFVGDKPDTDITGANRAGVISIRVRQGRNAKVEPANDDEKPDIDLPSIDILRTYLAVSM